MLALLWVSIFIYISRGTRPRRSEAKSRFVSCFLEQKVRERGTRPRRSEAESRFVSCFLEQKVRKRGTRPRRSEAWHRINSMPDAAFAPNECKHSFVAHCSRKSRFVSCFLLLVMEKYFEK